MISPFISLSAITEIKKQDAAGHFGEDGSCTMSREHEAQVRSWGFSHVFTWTDAPRAHYLPHSHSGLTTHLVVSGQLTLWYPNEPGRKKVQYSAGDRIDVDAGRVHEVWIGDQGCTYVIGEERQQD
ncbi:hypothetical protein E4U43_003537 [Claviceps pusilla]|uniref:Uncharacterized protein n=1 Tax=Claviceps pusilla TaxID=123648 RepID=A0A9P7N705_9HYPO|nr:hypothetical protein E4U43_003537 [Claviceps pusilla]